MWRFPRNETNNMYQQQLNCMYMALKEGFSIKEDFISGKSLSWGSAGLERASHHLVSEFFSHSCKSHLKFILYSICLVLEHKNKITHWHTSLKNKYFFKNCHQLRIFFYKVHFYKLFTKIDFVFCLIFRQTLFQFCRHYCHQTPKVK